MAKILLNKDQEKAVKHKSGPLLVVAGAGTGKTRVITERIKHLIKDQKVHPQKILAVTFTEKASHEMLERLDDVMPLGYEEPWIYTFHTFCDRILKNEGLEIGVSPSFKILPYPEQWLLVRQNFFDFDLKYFRPLGNPNKFISSILKFISRLQDEYITPEEFENFANHFEGESDEKERWQELSEIYTKYTQIKLDNAKMDFGDLITYTIKLFKERPNILRKYQQKFEHILVDEFQDTNYAQYELIKLLANENSLKNRSLLAVGDDSQSIYKFRGAAISNILDFIEDYPKAEMVTLLDNYRSTQEILDPSYKLVQNNNPDTLESKLNISKELTSKATFENVSKPVIINVDTLEDEVEYVVRKIYEVLGSESEYTYKDIAILARANNHLDPFVFALRQHGLPYQLVGNRGLYDRDEVRDILALLKIIINTEDSISLYRVLNIDCLEIDSSFISKLLSEAKYKKVSLFDLMKESNDDNASKVVELITTFQKQVTDTTPTEFVHALVNSIGYIKNLLKEETIENQLSINNLNLFLDRVKKFEVDYRQESNEMPMIIDFVEYLDLIIEAGENPAQAEIEDIDTINLLTVHSSKGLEFNVVFMINLVSDRFPTRNRKDLIELPDEIIKEKLPSGNAHIQEERRLFYVGMTRAKKYLHMLWAKNYGGKREKKPSGYLQETGLETNHVAFDRTQENKPEASFKSPKVIKVDNHVPTSLSYSKISTYKTCPLQYKYQYVLNIPTPPSHALSFGITIHDTLRDFHTKQTLGIDVSIDNLLKMYQENWQPLGYESAKHRQTRFENGEQLLKKYYKKVKNEEPKILGLEKNFNLKLGGIKFTGRIDRIDKLESGGVEIIDYKTGKTKTQKQVDKDDQVAFYALAAQKALGLQPEKLTYYFLEGDEKVTTTRTQAQLDKVEEKVSEVVEELKKGNFEANPGMHCTWCDFKDVCPFAYKN